MRKYYTYIISNKKNGTLYIGVTNDLLRRIFEHKEGKIEGFTKKCGLKNLVYYEEYESIEDAILREKQLKGWLRKKKIDLIESCNRNWEDLYYMDTSLRSV
ncbi:MAG: GIY-YIG nuclease family protein [Endomicrobia bacterium]|nr:GIY-YIG nuclease family protein [Endomicrobiia bacterium]